MSVAKQQDVAMSEAVASREIKEEPSSLEEAADFLLALKSSSRLPGQSTDDFKPFRILERAAQLGVQDSAHLSRFLRKHLVPLCCAAGTKEDGLVGNRYRELLRGWIESLPEHVLRKVREDVLSDVTTRLRRSPNDATLYCLSVIGFRSRKTVDTLRAIAKRDDEMGDRALRVLGVLGPRSKDRVWISRLLKQRLRRRQNDELFMAAVILGGTEWLPFLSNRSSADTFIWPRFGQLSWLCDDAPGDGQLQDQVWNEMTRLRQSLPDGWPQVLFTGGALKRCHSARALEEVVNGIAEIAPLGQIHVWRWCNQLESLQSKAQVLGWIRIERTKVIARLREILERPSGQQGRWSTTEGDLKRDALHLLLCTGDRSILDWANNVIATEENSYVRQTIMEALAALSFSTIPEEVVNLLSTPLDVDPSSQPPIELEHLAAARLTGCSQKLSSLQSLLQARLTSKGHPYLSPVNGGAALAWKLFRAGEKKVLELLVGALRERASAGALLIASKAASNIAGEITLPMALLTALFDLASDTTQPTYIRKEALRSITHAAARTGDRESLDFLKQLTKTPDLELSCSAIAGLIYALPDDEFFELGASYWDERVPELVQGDTELSRRVAAIYGQLAARDPSQHGSRAANALKGPWNSAAVLWGFRWTRWSPWELPAVMSEELARSICEHESAVFGNLGLIRELALLAPRRFFREEWHQVWDSWMPDSRKQLADATRDAAELVAGEPEFLHRAIEILERLRGDSVFAVRRSAARALSKIDPSGLRKWCYDAISSGSIRARRIAAYAAGWLALDSDATLDNDLLRSLLRDEEHSVREAASRSREEARRRKWAAELFEMIREPHPDSNERVLRCYAAARALANVGDDSQIESLSKLLGERDIAPNVYFWITQTLKSLEQQWKKTTGKWPEPWLPWDGVIERMTGVLVSRNEEYQADFTLWRREGFGEQPSDWGGSVISDARIAGLKLMLAGAPYVTLRIPERVEATAIITQAGDSGTLLVGSGPYPSMLDRSKPAD